jgi:hypothetical protein
MEKIMQRQQLLIMVVILALMPHPIYAQPPRMDVVMLTAGILALIVVKLLQIHCPSAWVSVVDDCVESNLSSRLAMDL